MTASCPSDGTERHLTEWGGDGSTKSRSGDSQRSSRFAVAGPGWRGHVYGLVTETEARVIAESLSRSDAPPRSLPDVPWAAAVLRPDATVVATASMMMPAGLFYGLEVVSHGTELTIATDPGGALALRRGAMHLITGWQRAVDPTATPYEGIRRLPPGDTLVWHAGAGTIQIHQWCGPESLSEPMRARPGTESRTQMALAYREMFDDIVADLSRRSGVPVLALSGGLDSTFLAASLATAAPRPVRIHAFTWRPRAGIDLRGPSVMGDEFPLAAAMAAHYPGRIVVTPITREAEDITQVSRAAMRRSFLPCLAPTNQGWLDSIRDAARKLGAHGFFVGGHGNASFSVPRLPADRDQDTGPGRWRRRVRIGSKRSLADGRHAYLRWLTHRQCRSAGINPAASEGMFRLDPFSSRAVIEFAATIPGPIWSDAPGDRAFARLAGAGRVPEQIRLETRRGVQGWDVVDAEPSDGNSQVTMGDVAAALRASRQSAERDFLQFVGTVSENSSLAWSTDQL